MNWKDVVGYEGIYVVSDTGVVKRIAKSNNQYKEGHILKNNMIKGYANVQLHKNGKVKLMRVHRLVCMAFLENPENKPYVNHKDGNKANNNLSNLEWCTPSENEIHKHRVLNHTPCKYKLTNEQISTLMQLRMDGKRLHELASLLNVPVNTVHKVLRKNNLMSGYGGMYNGQSKLTDVQRKEICRLYAVGKKVTELAHIYNVNQLTIRRTLAKYYNAEAH